MKIKPLAAGKYYPDNKSELLNLFKELKSPPNSSDSRLIIVPHAGFEFIREISIKTYSALNDTAENVIIFAPATYNLVYGTVTSDAEAFVTPFGKIAIKPYDTEINNKIFASETALTVQLPFVKYFYPKTTLTPIIYGCEDYKNIAKIIENEIDKSLIIISSNLSRFLPEREALKLDDQTSRMIENKQTEDFDSELADGAVGICGAIEFAKKRTLNFIRTGYTNSAKTNGDTSNVVGYSGWYLA